jgi:hypothetical protein
MEASSGHVPASAALQEAPMHLGEATDTGQPGELTEIRCALAMQRYRACKLRRLWQCFGRPEKALAMLWQAREGFGNALAGPRRLWQCFGRPEKALAMLWQENSDTPCPKTEKALVRL